MVQINSQHWFMWSSSQVLAIWQWCTPVSIKEHIFQNKMCVKCSMTALLVFGKGIPSFTVHTFWTKNHIHTPLYFISPPYFPNLSQTVHLYFLWPEIDGYIHNFLCCQGWCWSGSWLFDADSLLIIDGAPRRELHKASQKDLFHTIHCIISQHTIT